VHVYLDKQIHVDMDTIVSFVIQSGQVLEGERSLCRLMLIRIMI